MPEPGAVVLGGLERSLIEAAGRRYPQRRVRRWAIPAVICGALAAGGVALAASGVLGGKALETGSTPEHGADSGPFAIRISPRHADPTRPLCLQLQFAGSRPAFGCGVRPSVDQPFGVVVADGLSEESTDRVIYGVVASDVARVSSIDDSGSQAIVDSVAKPNLPGRYFSVVVPNQGQIELLGFDASGAEIAHVGSHEPPTEPPLSRDEAIAQGDPSGFAATVVPARRYLYRGETIDPREAERRHLVCVEGRVSVTCYDTIAEQIAAEPVS